MKYEGKTVTVICDPDKLASANEGHDPIAVSVFFEVLAIDFSSTHVELTFTRSAGGASITFPLSVVIHVSY